MSNEIQTTEELQDRFEEMLNELGTVKIGNLEYDSAMVLKQVDPIAYKEALLEYADAENIEIDELEGELDV
jgi:hypothetical protein